MEDTLRFPSTCDPPIALFIPFTKIVVDEEKPYCLEHSDNVAPPPSGFHYRRGIRREAQLWIHSFGSRILEILFLHPQYGHLQSDLPHCPSFYLNSLLPLDLIYSFRFSLHVSWVQETMSEIVTVPSFVMLDC